MEQVNNEPVQNNADALNQVAPSPTIVTTTRDYTLNIDRTLRTKLNACESVKVNYEIKRGGVTGTLDTASFELLRAACTAFFKNMHAEEGKCVINISEDKRRKAVVQQTYKFTRSHENEVIGYTLNLYPTRNSLLLNGKDTDTFIDVHLPAIHVLMCKTVKDWEVGSAENLNRILGEGFSHILASRQAKNSENQDNPHLCVSRGITPPPRRQDTLVQTASSPPPDKEQEDIQCIKCKRNCMGRSAFCETGNHWIHYYCDRLSKEEERRLHNDKGFIYVCKVCRSKSEDTNPKTVYEDKQQTLRLPKMVCPEIEETKVNQTAAEALLREEEYQICFVCHENMGNENCCDLCSGPCHQRCMFIKPDGEVTDICMNCATTHQQEDQGIADPIQPSGQPNIEESQNDENAENILSEAMIPSTPTVSITPIVSHNSQTTPDHSPKALGDKQQASQTQVEKQEPSAGAKAIPKQGKKKDTDGTVKLRELRQLEAKYRKWEEELKVREARLASSDTDYRRMEDYLQKTEARNLELESTVRTLQRRISLLEQNPNPSQLGQGAPHKDIYSSPKTARMYQSNANEWPNTEQNRSNDMTRSGTHTAPRDPHASLIKGIHQQVTGFLLQKVAKQIAHMEMLDTEIAKANNASLGNTMNGQPTVSYQTLTDPIQVTSTNCPQPRREAGPALNANQGLPQAGMFGLAPRPEDSINTQYSHPSNHPHQLYQGRSHDFYSQMQVPRYNQVVRPEDTSSGGKLNGGLQNQWRQNVFTVAEVESGHTPFQPQMSTQNRSSHEQPKKNGRNEHRQTYNTARDRQTYRTAADGTTGTGMSSRRDNRHRVQDNDRSGHRQIYGSESNKEGHPVFYNDSAEERVPGAPAQGPSQAYNQHQSFLGHTSPPRSRI